MQGRPTGQRTVFATVVPFLAFQLPMIPALLLFETGLYSAEIGEAGRPIGSNWPFMAYVALALTAFSLITNIAPSRAPSTPDKRFISLVNGASLLMLLYYSIPVMIYGPTPLTGLTRYQFVDLPLADIFNIKIYIAIACVYHGWLFTNTKNRFHLFYFFGVIIMMIAWGEKFSGPAYAMIYFLTGAALTAGILRRLAIISMVFVPVAFAIWALPTYLQDRSDELAGAFVNRLGRQAQLFFKVIDEPPQHEDARALPEIFDYFGTFTPQRNGMPYLKDTYIAPELADEHKGSLAGGYPAIIFTQGIGIGLLLAFFLELLRFALMREVLIVGVNAHKIYLIPVYIYLLAYIGKIYESGNTYLLTSPVFLAMIAIIVVGNRIAIIGQFAKSAFRVTQRSSVVPFGGDRH